MASAPGIRSIAVNGFTSTGLTGAEVLVRAAYFIAITRLVGPEGYGLWTYAIALYGLVLSGVSLGLETLIPNAYGNDTARGDRFAGTALALRLAGCTIAGAGLLLYALVLEPAAATRWAIVLVAPALVFRGTALAVRAVFTGRQDVPRTAAPILAGRIAELLVGLAIILAGGGILILLALHGLCWAIELLLSWRRLRHGSTVRLAVPDRAATMALVRSGVPVTLLDLSNGFLMSAAVILYEPYARSYGEIGQIGVAVQLAGFMLAAKYAFLGTAAPVLARSVENRDRRVVHYGWLVALGSVGITAAALVVYELLSVPMFQLVLGDRYELARVLTFTTVLTAGIIVVPHGFQQLLILEGRVRGLLLANGTAFVALLVMFFRPGVALDPQNAVLATMVGWSVRALMIVLLGWFHARELAVRFRPE